jgi:hypothetical protein
MGMEIKYLAGMKMARQLFVPVFLGEPLSKIEMG